MFLDFSNAFDIVPWQELWKILKDMQIDTDLLRILQMQHADITVILLTKDGLTHEMTCNLGVRQGDPDNLDLFAFVMQQYEKVLIDAPNGNPLNIQRTEIKTPTYADDVLLLSRTPEGLQQLLQRTKDFPQSISLELVQKSRLSWILVQMNMSLRFYGNVTQFRDTQIFPQLGAYVAVDEDPTSAINDRTKLG